MGWAFSYERGTPVRLDPTGVSYELFTYGIFTNSRCCPVGGIGCIAIECKATEHNCFTKISSIALLSKQNTRQVMRQTWMKSIPFFVGVVGLLLSGEDAFLRSRMLPCFELKGCWGVGFGGSGFGVRG